MRKTGPPFLTAPGMVVFLVLFFLAGGLFLVRGTRGMGELRSYAIPPIDMSHVRDGSHHGTSSIGRWAIDVVVTVRNNLIVDVRILQKGRSNLTEELKAQIDKNLISREKPLLDAVSGATMTSKGYLIAVADALRRRESSP